MPLVFESFGDFKSPLYGYLTVPTVWLFGLNKFAVRLPNALLGAMAVYVVYLLAKKLLPGKWPLITAFLLVVSPWHIMLTRGAFEANLISFLIPLGIYFFLKEKYNYSAATFGISLFSYHSAKLLAPAIFIGLLVLFKVKKMTPVLLFAGFFGLLIWANSLGGGARVAERSIYAGSLEEGAKTKIELINQGMNPILARALHNKYQVTAKRFIGNYKQYVSAKFLFSDGAAETTYGMIPGQGVIYPIQGLLLLGTFLLKEKRLKGLAVLFTVWLLLAPLPAALATGVGYSANRAAGMIVPLTILSSLGLIGWWQALKGEPSQSALSIVFGLVFLIGFTQFLGLYFVKSPGILGPGMLSGNLEAAAWLSENRGDDPPQISKSLSEPHIYVAFAEAWDPKKYQEATKSWDYKEAGVNWVDQLGSYGLGDYLFQTVDWKKNPGKSGSLLVGRPDEFTTGVTPEKIFYYPGGKEAIYIVKAD